MTKMDEGEIERIVSVAIKHKLLTFSLDAPARHGDLISALYDSGMRDACHSEQGFLTSQGRFVKREEARKIALWADQVKPGVRAVVQEARELFSEDVW